jgi:hypothetical protein
MKPGVDVSAILMLVLAGAALCGLVAVAHSTFRQRQWPRLTATVLAWTPVQDEEGCIHPSLRVIYSAQGRVVTTDHWLYGTIGCGLPNVQRLAARHPVGSRVAVQIDPGCPERFRLVGVR